MNSRYIVFPTKGQVDIREESIPRPKTGEVLCKADKSLVSIGTELNCLRGEFDPGSNWEAWVQYPFRPGYSMVGHVITVGDGVSTLKVGDRVAVYATHQEYFTAPAADCFRIPDSITDEDATWRSLACTTQLGVRRATLTLGETVGVIGLGMLGQLVVQYLALSGARKIVAIDPAQKRLDIAHRHGATHVLPLTVTEAIPAVRDLTEGRMLDVVFDITGHPAVLAPAIQLCRRLGRLVLLGDTPTPTQQHLGPGVVSNSIAILGIHGFMAPVAGSEFSPWSIPEMSSLFFDYLAQGRMQVADLITHRYSPLEAPQVYMSLQRSRADAVGILFDWKLPG